LQHPCLDGGFGQQEAKPPIIKQELHVTIDRSHASKLMLAAVLAAQVAALPPLAHAAEAEDAIAYLPTKVKLPQWQISCASTPVSTLVVQGGQIGATPAHPAR
jgi:hypothetical protein